MIGLDFYKTITAEPKAFKRLASAYMALGYPVYIISAIKLQNASKLAQELKATKVPYTHLEIVTFNSLEEIPALKLAVCQRLGIKVMYDDMESTCTLLAEHGIMTFQVRK